MQVKTTKVMSAVRQNTSPP